MAVLLESKLQSEHSAEQVSRAAADALRREAWIAPKPGLVDRFDSGAHRDMNLHTFYHSAETIAPFLGRMAACGALRVGQPPKAVFAQARRIGLEAEAAMFTATGGVNTHKGAIFSLGLLSTAWGYVRAARTAERGAQAGPVSEESLLQCAGAMVAGIVDEELASDRDGCPTAGARVYRTYGLTGIRGEAELGFPAVRSFGIPVLRLARQAGLNADASGLQVLLSLMTVVEDSNVAARGGLAALGYTQAAARRALAAGGMYTAAGRNCIKKMNREFVKRNLSPGGCADLLAVTLFLDTLGKG
ncbi:MAG: triphosphoribosyl-dephospho-CoA synthase CitG [bacterium]